MSTKQPKCCVCFNIETGVKLITALTFVNTIGSCVDMYFYRENDRLYLPFAILYALQFIIMMVCAHRDSVINRHVMFASYMLLVFIGTKGLSIHYLLKGVFIDHDFCAEGQLVTDCEKEQRIYIWIWFGLAVLVEAYFLSQLLVWAKRPLKKYDDKFAHLEKNTKEELNQEHSQNAIA